MHTRTSLRWFQGGGKGRTKAALVINNFSKLNKMVTEYLVYQIKDKQDKDSLVDNTFIDGTTFKVCATILR